MPPLKIGNKAPDFKLPTDGGGALSLKDLRGKTVVLYFYPKDDTPGCTRESCDFRDNLSALKKLGALVVGVSKDSVARHDKFKARYDLNFPLISDEEGKACERYGVWVEKKNYGKSYMGIERSSFLIDPEGIIRAIWRKVRVENHVSDVMAALKDMRKAA